ncbi:hypothetical protein, partial [Hyphomonas sp.]|uniref:hypothetical protein n=1 Tax=Hyphomonas sp. TaxID=87 RepID=UPI0032D967AE
MSEMTDKFPTAAACDIVGHNRQRLNEDIAQGFYPCAPEAHHKIGRWWNEDDLCALRVYSFLLNVYGAQDDRDRA